MRERQRERHRERETERERERETERQRQRQRDLDRQASRQTERWAGGGGEDRIRDGPAFGRGRAPRVECSVADESGRRSPVRSYGRQPVKLAGFKGKLPVFK